MLFRHGPKPVTPHRLEHPRRLGAVAAGAGLLVAAVASMPAATAAPVPSGAVLYAAPAASGTGDCSTAANACTLTTALGLALPGTTVLLTAAGVEANPSTFYVGNWTVATSGTTSTSPVTIEPAPLTKDPILDGDGSLGATCSTDACDGAVLSVGAGVYFDLRGVTVQDALNEASGRGGGLANGGGTVSVTNSTFSDDSAEAFASSGGAIDNSGGGVLTVSNSTFVDDTSGYFGGAIGNATSSSGTATVTDSTFIGNSSADGGGAIDNQEYYGTGDVTVIASTFSANGGYGSITDGIYGGSGDVTLAANIIDGYCVVGNNPIVDDGYNVGPVGDDCDNGGTGDSLGLAPGFGSNPSSPELSALANHKGPTATIEPLLAEAATGNAPNPAIGAIPAGTSVTINGASVALCPAYDQRGYYNQNGPCEAGSVQAYGPAPVLKVTGISPNTGPTTGSTPITITGTGFAPGASVLIGQGSGPNATAISAYNVNVVSANEITADTGGGAKAGKHSVFVVLPDGASANNPKLDSFTYTNS